jgi:hypothetical protein
MGEFVLAVERVRDRLVDTLNPQAVDVAAFAYAQDDERLFEAEAVESCVLRFAVAEVSPPGNGKPVGRYAGVSVAPPIGTYLQKSGDRESVAVPARRLVIAAVAHGYFAMVEADALGKAGEGPDADVVPGRTAEEIWRYWVTNMSTGGVPKTVAHAKAIDQIAGVAGEELWQGLQELGLAGWRRGRKIYTDASTARQACCCACCKPTVSSRMHARRCSR